MATPEPPAPDTTPWYLRPGLSRRIVTLLAAALGALVLAEILVAVAGSGKKAYFPWEKWPGLYAIAGLASSIALVLAARFVLRPLVKRDESYYEPHPTDQGGKNDA